MSWKNLNNYFQSIPKGFLETLFENSQYPWSPLAKLKSQIELTISGFRNQGALPADRKLIYNSDFSLKEGAYFLRGSEVLESDFVDKELNIYEYKTISRRGRIKIYRLQD